MFLSQKLAPKLVVIISANVQFHNVFFRVATGFLATCTKQVIMKCWLLTKLVIL